MRLRAMREAGWTQTMVHVVDWPEKKQLEFMIKDNASFGQWDFDILANQWDLNELEEWGVDVYLPEEPESDEEDQQSDEDGEVVFSQYLGESSNYVVLKFDNDVDWLSAQTHFNLDAVYSKRANGKPWSKGIGRVIDGAKYLKELKTGKK